MVCTHPAHVLKDPHPEPHIRLSHYWGLGITLGPLIKHMFLCPNLKKIALTTKPHSLDIKHFLVEHALAQERGASTAAPNTQIANSARNAIVLDPYMIAAHVALCAFEPPRGLVVAERRVGLAILAVYLHAQVLSTDNVLEQDSLGL